MIFFNFPNFILYIIGLVVFEVRINSCLIINSASVDAFLALALFPF